MAGSSDETEDPAAASDHRPSSARRAGSAYLVRPEGSPGPGVLVLHSWWGLTPGVKAVVEQLADQGYTALAPALLTGRPADAGEAAALLAETDADATAALVLSSIVALRAQSADPDASVGIVGYSMGASWALWAAARQPGSVAAVAAYYGYQDIDFAELRAEVLCHFAQSDPLITEDQATGMQAHLRLAGVTVEVEHHPGTRHFFAEADVPVLDADGTPGERNPDEEAAAAAAWTSTVALLDRALRP
ncbi:MAG: dienelactone hydrolase family protein [Microthrixaceae bacterium]